MLGTSITLKLLFGKSIGLIGTRIVQFLLVAVVFVPLERLIPFRPRQRLFRQYFFLDLLHYFVGGIFILIFVHVTYFSLPVVSSWAQTWASPLSLKNLPWWGQFLVFEAGWTFLGYWVHRWEHVWEPLWRMHSVHESSRELDWLSAFRLHPLEPAMFQVLTIIPLWLLQIKFPVALGYTIYTYVLSHVQHSNVVFPIGPLKYIFPTPEFHRWHHARVIGPDGRDMPGIQNFGQYPIWDLMFGTFYLPETRPVAYGSEVGDRIPTNYFAQLAYPFGLHEQVLSIQRKVEQRIGMQEKLTRVKTALAPSHEAWERRLAALCLVPGTGVSGSDVRTITPMLKGENP